MLRQHSEHSIQILKFFSPMRWNRCREQLFSKFCFQSAVLSALSPPLALLHFSRWGVTPFRRSFLTLPKQHPLTRLARPSQTPITIRNCFLLKEFCSNILTFWSKLFIMHWRTRYTISETTCIWANSAQWNAYLSKH